MFTPNFRRSISRITCSLLVLVAACNLSGCIQARLKRLEIHQLETQLNGTKETEEYLRTEPKLASAYGGRLFVRGALFNRFLDGLRDYTMPLDNPRGAALIVERAQLIFQDGPPQAEIAVRAKNRNGSIEVKLRMRADLLMVADTEKSTIELTFAIREVVPEVRLSIFRLRQLLFVAGLLRLKAQKYADALPATSIPLQVELPIPFNPPDESDMKLGNHATLYVRQRMHAYQRNFRYRVQRVVTLEDGIHVFLSLESVK